MSICCCGFGGLPWLFGTDAEKIDNSSCVGMSALYCLLDQCYLCWIPHLKKRKILRQKYHLQEEPCNDCLVTAFCSECSNCQDTWELKAKAEPHSGPTIMPIRGQPQTAYRN